MRSPGKLLNPGGQGVEEGLRPQVPVAQQKVDHPLLANLLPLRQRRMRLWQAIRVEEDQISTLQMQGFALVLLLVEDPHQQPSCLECTPAPIGTDQEGRIMAGIAILNGPRLGIDQGIDQRQQQLAAEVAVDAKIGIPQDAARSVPSPGDAAHDAPGRSHPHRRPNPLAGDVSDHHAEALLGEAHVVVEVPAQIEGRLEPGRKLESAQVGRRLGNHRPLYVASHHHFMLKLPLPVEPLLVETGIGDGDAEVVGHTLQQAGVVLLKGIARPAFEGDHPDDVPLEDEGHSDLRALPLPTPVLRDVVIGILPNIVGDLGTSFPNRPSNDSPVDRCPRFPFLLLGSIPKLDMPDKLLPERIDQTDQQKFIGDDAIEEGGDVVEKPIEVENRGDLVSNLDQCLHLPGSLSEFLVDTGVLEGDGKVAADQLQRPLVLFLEVVLLGALDRQDSNDLLLGDQQQRDGDLGPGRPLPHRTNREIPLILRYIADVDGLLLAPSC